MSAAETSRTEDALTTSVLTIDAARRVGWAKAFDGQRKNEELSRDNNLLREERDAYRKGMSFLYGVVTGYSSERPVNVRRALAGELGGYEVFVDADAVTAGRAHASALAAMDLMDDERADAKARRRRAARSSQSAARQWFDAGRRRERDLIRRRFGFHTRAEMFAVLGKWREATGRSSLMSNRATKRFDSSLRTTNKKDLRRLSRLVQDVHLEDPEESQ